MIRRILKKAGKSNGKYACNVCLKRPHTNWTVLLCKWDYGRVLGIAPMCCSADLISLIRYIPREKRTWMKVMYIFFFVSKVIYSSALSYLSSSAVFRRLSFPPGSKVFAYQRSLKQMVDFLNYYKWNLLVSTHVSTHQLHHSSLKCRMITILDISAPSKFHPI